MPFHSPPAGCGASSRIDTVASATGDPVLALMTRTKTAFVDLAGCVVASGGARPLAGPDVDVGAGVVAGSDPPIAPSNAAAMSGRRIALLANLERRISTVLPTEVSLVAVHATGTQSDIIPRLRAARLCFCDRGD